VHIPDGQGIWVLILQLPLPSQVGVISVVSGHDGEPQAVSGGWNPAIWHTALPESHETIPTSHGFARMQVPPAAQGTHEPPLQTMSVPQLVPSGTALFESRQVMIPVWQLYVPL
jgi:hypothetical protein